MLERHDWLLLALASAGREMSPVQVQKCMFLLKMEASECVGSDFYDFAPYNYGPFNVDIYYDLERLASGGLVIIDASPNRRWRSYSLMPRGYEVGQTLRAELDSRVATFLDRLVAWVTSQSFSGLLQAIYAKYPNYSVNSIFSA